MKTAAIVRARTASFDRIQPKDAGITGRRSDSRAVRQALEALRAVSFSAAAHRDALRADVPFICG